MMQLVSVITASATEQSGVLTLEVLVQHPDERQEMLPYGYTPGDPHGLGPQLDAWWADNPDFPVDPLPTPTLEQARSAKLAALDERRWVAEIAGTTFNGIPIRTDENSQNKIDGAVTMFNNDEELVYVEFEAQPGVWVDLDQPTLVAMGVTVGRHVQATFSRKRALYDEIISAETVEALDAINIDEGWPGQEGSES